MPNKYLILIDHIRFAIFPYLVEYLSFPYYIIVLTNEFISSFDESDKTNTIILIILNTLLIILYNFDLFWDMICVNKIFTISIYDIPPNNNFNFNRNNHLSYKCSIYIIYILIIFQNISIFLNIENFINNKKLFRIIITIFILILLLIIIYKLLNQFDYNNYILYIMNISFLFCFYTIFLDLIIASFLDKTFHLFKDIIYALVKIIISYIVFSLIMLKRNHLLQTNIVKLLFLENNDKTKPIFIDSLYYLHENMLKIKMNQNIKNSALIISFIYNNHIKKCNKAICNCKLLNYFINKEILNNNELIKYNQKLIMILNFLFESIFINYEYYKNFDSSILLAEHFCHNKDNPIMAFSIVNTFFIKQKNINMLSKQQKVILYELSQKYVYYITTKFKNMKEIKQDEEEFLLNDNIEKEFVLNFSTLKMMSKIKINMINYINNYINILKYKNIFDDSLSFIYDENNENVISIKNNFFKQTNKIDNESNKKNNLENFENKPNLYIAIYLIRKEKFFYGKIIKSIDNINEMKNMPIEMIFKYILFINMFENEKMKIKDKLYKLLNNNKRDYYFFDNRDEFKILKKCYKNQNNETNSKIYSIFEFKREIIIKYFSEYGALKLGFKQSEIINEKMDILMPEQFRNSHLNVVKYSIINQQEKLNLNKQSYFFDKATTRLYPVNMKVSFIYNINKNLNFLSETIFVSEKEYRFMLDNNFQLLANSNNFEEEYYLNQKIFQSYNINVFDLLNISPDKIKDLFKYEIKSIHHQKLIRQIKTEEYILSQLYVPPGEKSSNMMNINHFKKSKKKIISKLLDIDNKNKSGETLDEEKENNFIKSKNDLYLDLFTKSETIVSYKVYNKILNKKYFIEKIGKELLKISQNDLILEKDKINYNLFINAKQLINQLLYKKESTNDSIPVSTKFCYFYDKYYYFITIKDENK